MSEFPRIDNHSGVWKLGNLGQYQVNGLWPNASGRGIFGAGKAPGQVVDIDFVTIASAGNAADFGDLTIVSDNRAAGSSGTRGLFMGGIQSYPGVIDNIELIQISTKGNATDFGDLTAARGNPCGISNEIKSIATGGGDNDLGYSNVIDQVQNATLGNATDFGNLTQSRGQGGSVNNATIGLSAGGIIATNDNQDRIDKIIIQTEGNAVDYGNLVAQNNYLAGCSSSTRGIFHGGLNPNATTQIQFYTINSEGNAVDFGDLSAVSNRNGATSNSKRGVLALGSTPGNNNTLEQVEIATTGNSVDFGDLTSARSHSAGLSDSHGGLNQGYDRLEAQFGIHALFSSAYAGGSINDVHHLSMQSKGNSVFFGDLASANYSHSGAGNRHEAYFSGGSAGVNVIQRSRFATSGRFQDFGDLTQGKRNMGGGQAGSKVRGLYAGGYITSPGNAVTNVIEHITFSSTGGGTDFGDLTAARRVVASASSPTRSLFQGGVASTGTPGTSAAIDFVTTASTGNGQDFGDLVSAKRDHSGGASAVRAVSAGNTGNSDAIDFVTIASAGDAADFGDLTVGRSSTGAASNSQRLVIYGGVSPGANVTIDEIQIATQGNATDFGDAARGGAKPGGAGSGHGGVN